MTFSAVSCIADLSYETRSVSVVSRPNWVPDLDRDVFVYRDLGCFRGAGHENLRYGRRTPIPQLLSVV